MGAFLTMAKRFDESDYEPKRSVEYGVEALVSVGTRWTLSGGARTLRPPVMVTVVI